MRRWPLVLSCLAVVMWGCATTAVTRLATQPLSKIVGKKYMIAAITNVLTINGFNVAAVDEKQGTISSDWRAYADSADTGLNVLTNTVHSREIMIGFHISANEYEIMPKVKLKSSKTNGSDEEHIEYVRKGSTEESIVIKITEEVNKQINEPSNIQWVDRIDLSGQDNRQ